MAMQKPVIFTNKGPGPEIITHGKTGLLCNPHSAEDIAEKIIWSLSHKQESKQMGIEARKDILKRFDLKTLLEKNMQFYEKICKH
ncbi:MAG: glycosyltransferase [Lutibacter sp.]